ncbi:MAG: aminopeptidase P N-terminal domain-containing protein [Lachnospiraceae bacterium]|nr:aminopeptidase P N-terminal domain-containing protein [Lachnospiraceae bacterium]
MEATFYKGNRTRLYEKLPEGSIVVIFSGEEIIKTNDEYYPFFADRNFVYLTGLEGKEEILLATKDADGSVSERLYILKPDFMLERWTGVRIKPDEATAKTGIEDIRYVDNFENDFRKLAYSTNYGHLYLDLYRVGAKEIDRPAHRLLKYVQQHVPFFQIGNACDLISQLRLIKQPCEIEAYKKAEQITKDGIVAMMKSCKPGMYEYQLKAEYDRALGQYSPKGPGFPSIISAGNNNFCIHYYSYTGEVHDGDMVLNDVGATWDNMITDVSRGWPANGKYNEKQRLLYECALKTSKHMFETIKPGMKMADVDKNIKIYNGQLLIDAGVMKSQDEIATYMWHNGAHHIGFDVHDVVKTPEIIAPNMAFCIDIGIYHEEWGIGFRLEDNCLVTENGCENMSKVIPYEIDDIEGIMN